MTSVPALVSGPSTWRTQVGVRPAVLAEAAVILLWTLVITRPYLDLDAAVIPTGSDYFNHLQPNHLWDWVKECGLCALWNGSTFGGVPALANPFGAHLHPLVALTTLAFGVLTGAKLALVGAFLLAGLAQWWLGHVLGVGRASRLWGACLVVAAGHLAGRMEAGWFIHVIGTATSALVLPALIALSRAGARRSAVLLGLSLVLVAVAGHAYLQIGLGFALLAGLVLLPWERERVALLVRRFALALGLAALLAAPFVVPMLHFLPEFGKALDPQFSTAQPFAYVPLNLVIDDPQFYKSDALYKKPYASHHTTFVGWVPVLLAVYGLFGSRSAAERRARAFLVCFSLLALWFASAGPLAWMARTVPLPPVVEFLTGIRHPSVAAGLALPAIVGLASMGLDRLLRLRWPRLGVATSAGGASALRASLDTRWVLLVPLALALLQARDFGRAWIGTYRFSAEELRPRQGIEGLRTADLQWVAVAWVQDNPADYKNVYWIEVATALGFKLPFNTEWWHWKGQPRPEPFVEAHLQPQAGKVLRSVVDGVHVYEVPGREYAAVTHPDGSPTVCYAQGRGGRIDVACEAPEPGILTVKENSWSGWGAWLDGKALDLRHGRWLEVELPAGRHIVQFRYRPWDALLGIILALVGLGLGAYLFIRPDRGSSAS